MNISQISQCFLNDCLRKEAIQELLIDEPFCTRFLFKPKEAIGIYTADNINVMHICANADAPLLFDVQYGIYNPKTQQILNEKSKSMSAYQLVQFFKVYDLTIQRKKPNDHICAVFLPQTYHTFGLYQPQPYYIQQRLMYTLEKLIREHGVRHFIICLIGNPSIDAAAILVKLRNTYPFLVLEFIQDNKTNVRDNLLYQYVLEQAEITYRKDGEFPYDKYLNAHGSYPKRVIYAVNKADKIVAWKNTYPVDKAVQLAECSHKVIHNIFDLI